MGQTHDRVGHGRFAAERVRFGDWLPDNRLLPLHGGWMGCGVGLGVDSSADLVGEGVDGERAAVSSEALGCERLRPALLDHLAELGAG